MRRFVCLLACIALIAGCGGDDGSHTVTAARLTSINPTTVYPGQSDTAASLFGSSLEGTVSVSLGDGIDIHSAEVYSPSEVRIRFSVSESAIPGVRSITLYAVEGTVTLDNALTVSGNRVPRAAFVVSPPAGFRSTVFQFDASASRDPDGSISSYRWDFDDGSSASGKTVNHKFSRSDLFNVRLTVKDSGGATAIDERFVDVAVSQPPTASFVYSPSIGGIGSSIQFDGSASSDNDGRIVSYSWTFGDGGSAIGRTATHSYSQTGSFRVELTVVDNSNVSGSQVRFVTITDDDGGGGGGGGGSCEPNNFNANFFTVISYSGNTITADQSFQECPGLCGEVRRPGGKGIQEFVGDILSISGSQIRISTGSLPASTRPQPGERLNVLWRPCGS